MGGSITIHAFGAYYGLAASMVLSNGRQAFGAYTSSNIKNSATYVSNIFSMYVGGINSRGFSSLVSAEII